MTEEIIIDGVNVAGCKHFKYDGIKKPICRSGGCRGVYKNCLCEGNIDCDFKQLKRLEQERDELKFENDRYKQLLKGCPTEDEDCGLCVIDEQNKRLKQENKELKDYSRRMKNQRENYYKEYNNYRSALEEIREKVKNPITLSCFASAKFVLEQIDKKINEVLNEKEL